jgi:hypothetical protein
MATPQDAELILRLYELRRDPTMRQARIDVQGRFVPRSFEDVQAVTKPDHALNTAYRMVSSYWEMAASFVKHKALDLELFSENCAEGLFLFAKVEPFLERIRKEVSATAYLNLEHVVRESAAARARLETFRKRVAAMKGAS